MSHTHMIESRHTHIQSCRASEHDMTNRVMSCTTWLYVCVSKTWLYVCVTWLNHVCVWHDLIMCVCDMTQLYVCVTWLNHVCVWHDLMMCVCNMTQSCARVWHDSITCVCDMSQSCMCVRWLVFKCDVTQHRRENDASVCVTWLSHMCMWYRVAKTHRMS